MIMKALSLLIVCLSFQPPDYATIVGMPFLSNSPRVRQDVVSTYIYALTSASSPKKQRAKKKLIALLKQSPERRGRVVSELINIVAEPDVRNLIITSPAKYETWRLAVEALGELKAVEALDALITCLDCNDGVLGLSLSRFPASKAVTEMGEAAVPKLGEALVSNERSIRARAALALGIIGGDEAKAILNNALRSENDQEVIINIQLSLSVIQRNQ